VADGKNYTIKPGDTLSTIVAQNPDLGYSSWQELRNANMSEIRRVGLEKMAAIGVGAGVTRQPCEIPGHNPSHLIDGGIHYDEPGSPTIYPGETLFLKTAPEPEPEDAEPEDAEPEKTDGNLIKKSKWDGTEYQAPFPKLEIFTASDTIDPQNPDIVYSADGKYFKLLSYSFTESVVDLEGSFSFNIENEEAAPDGLTVFDLIPNRSVVKIYEGDLDKAVFVGIIRSRKLGASMTSHGIKRTITFSGKSVISYITEYTLSLDARIPDILEGMSKTKELTDELTKNEEPLAIKEFMKITWEHFKKVSAAAKIETTGIADVINKFIGKDGIDDPEKYIEVTGKEQQLRYDVAVAFYKDTNNVIADVWRNILPDRVYELFSRCDDGEPKIIARQVPFGDPDSGNYDWSELPIYLISPVSLTAYDLEQSDEEVYTAFYSCVIGSARDRNFYRGTNQSGPDSLVRHDTKKQEIYGFKPLEIDFNGYDKAGNTRNANIDPLTKAVQALNKRAEYWYSRLDDMYSGSITICTDFNEPRTNPRVGCRAKFMGAEFYIKKGEHSWAYGGTPTIKLTVSRGMMYNEQGRMYDGEAGVIKNLGRRYMELEMGGVA